MNRNIGIATAYGYALSKGYQGTEEEFAELMARLPEFAAEAEASAQAATDSAGEAAQSESNAEAWAVGEREGEDVPQSDPTYQNNSKYYAELAGQRAGSAGSSATAAGNAKTAAEASAQAAETAQEAAEDAQTAAEAAQEAAEDAAESVSQSAAQIETNRQDIGDLKSAFNTLQPAATNADVGKALIVKTVDPTTGKPSSYEYGEAGGGGAPAIYDTASGTIASFEDGADGMPLKALTVNVEPVQAAGTPTPETPLPISGWTGAKVTRTGVNAWNEEWELGRWNPSTGGTYDYYNNQGCSKNFIPVAPNTTYVISSLATLQILFYDETESFIKYASWTRNPFTTPSNCHYIKFNCGGYGPTYNNNISINYPATDTEYHSGKDNTTYHITFPSEAGTVYGGTLTINADGNGELRARPYYASYNGEAIVGPWVSSMDVYAGGASPTIGAQVVDLGGTETVYQLTAQQVTTLLGTNNICADCGPVNVDYPADTKLYIQKINAPTDDNMIADAQIANGRYFIIGNNLYLSTTTIPAGDAIIPGTNCQQTNLAEALNALNT